MRIVVFVLTALFAQVADAQECKTEVWNAARTLQPWYAGKSSPRGQMHKFQVLSALTDAICVASEETGIPPLLALAVARRESSLLPTVGLGKVNGQRGERGYFQVMPGSPAERFNPGCSQHDPQCNAFSALRYMSFLRSTCGDDPWVWVSAYGSSRGCQSADESRKRTEVKLARSFYCSVDSSCSTTWPE